MTRDEQKQQMIKLLSNADSKKAMESLSMLFILDMSYDRGDICEAMKTVELQKGWR